MNMRQQKELTARMLGIGKKRVKLNPEDSEEIEKAITRKDVDSLIRLKAITIKSKGGQSRHRARKRAEQKKKGRRIGPGKRKGKTGARLSDKKKWMTKVRALRKMVREMRDSGKRTSAEHAKLYRQAGSGMFKDKAYLSLVVRKMKKEKGADKK